MFFLVAEDVQTFINLTLHVGHVHIHDEGVRLLRLLLTSFDVPLTNQELGCKSALGRAQLFIDSCKRFGLSFCLHNQTFGFSLSF